ncbi:hypothetical protein HY839_01695 [Candidatus Azambacteria bacterium]|nr:hypothetical protein [Candidatus Azambacteria bacterium]
MRSQPYAYLLLFWKLSIVCADLKLVLLSNQPIVIRRQEMKANITPSPTGGSFSIEFVAENQGESDLLVLVLENMRHKELDAKIFGYTDVKGSIDKVELSLTVKQEEERDIAPEPKKGYLC